MRSNIERKDSSVSECAENGWGWLKILEDMEDKKETLRTGSGEFDAPLNSNAEYNYTVKLGIGKDDLPFKRVFRPRQRPSTHVRSLNTNRELR